MTVQLADALGRPLPGCVAVLMAEELPNTNAVVSLALAATKLDNKDLFGKSDPFVRVSKARESGAWVPILKTEVRGVAGRGWLLTCTLIRRGLSLQSHSPLCGCSRFPLKP